MIAIKGMESQTDCQKCPFMATDGKDTLLSPMMCLALWATKHEVKHCIQGKILNDCPLIELVTCKDCKHRPVDDHGSIEPPYDVENRRLDETCPCINKADWRYSYVPEDEFFCAYVEKKSVTPAHKKSKWIFTKTILDKYGCTVECPSCHKKWTTFDEIRFEKETIYCPNCGEKMESEE